MGLGFENVLMDRSARLKKRYKSFSACFVAIAIIRRDVHLMHVYIPYTAT